MHATVHHADGMQVVYLVPPCVPAQWPGALVKWQAVTEIDAVDRRTAYTESAMNRYVTISRLQRPLTPAWYSIDEPRSDCDSATCRRFHSQIVDQCDPSVPWVLAVWTTSGEGREIQNIKGFRWSGPTYLNSSV